MMIACVSPSIGTVQESVNTLRYASRAKKLPNTPVTRTDPVSEHIASLQQEVESLRKECAYLRGDKDHSIDGHSQELMPITKELQETKAMLQTWVFFIFMFFRSFMNNYNMKVKILLGVLHC